MHWLDGIAQVIQHTSESLERPAFTALLNPSLAVVFERSERYQCVMAGTTSQDLRSRMPDMRVSIWLLRRAVVVVQLAAKKVQPVLQEQHAVILIVAWPGFDEQDLLVRKILGQTTGNDASRCAAADDDKVE